MKNRTIIWLVIAIVVLIILIYVALKNKTEAPKSNQEAIQEADKSSENLVGTQLPVEVIKKELQTNANKYVSKKVYSNIDGLKVYNYSGFLGYIPTVLTYTKDQLVGEQVGFANNYKMVSIKLANGTTVYAYLNDVRFV